MSYFVAPALLALTKEINTKYAPPMWPTLAVGDGAIGDTSHAARKSDHNPDYSAGGVVRAVDIGIEGRDKVAILNTVIGDPRVWYVIHNGIIYSRSVGWSARRYTGPSPHEHHIHVSLQGANGVSAAFAKQVAFDTSTWFDEKKVRTSGQVYLPNVRREFKIALGLIEGKNKSIGGVKSIQAALNLKPDGIVGKQTLAAWKKYEAQHSGSGSVKIPDAKSLKGLNLKVKLKQ